MQTHLFVYYRPNQAPLTLTKEQADELLEQGRIETANGKLEGPGTVLQLQPDEDGDVEIGGRRFVQVGAVDVPGSPEPKLESQPQRRRRDRFPKAADLASLQSVALQAPPAAALVGSVSAMERITLAALQRTGNGAGGPAAAVELLAEIEGLRDDLDAVASTSDLQDLGAMVAQMVDNQAQLAEQVSSLTEYVKGIVAQIMTGTDDPGDGQP